MLSLALIFYLSYSDFDFSTGGTLNRWIIFCDSLMNKMTEKYPEKERYKSEDTKIVSYSNLMVQVSVFGVQFVSFLAPDI